MSPAQAMIEEVDDILAGTDRRRRMAMLRQITNLFVDNARWLDENVIATFDEVMLRLAKDVDFRVRYAVSERLADIPRAPLKMVRELAFDDNYEVATPVLGRSEQLGDDDLIFVVETKSAMHVLAVSRRNSLSERVTDSIIARDEDDPIRALATNEGARFSDDGFARLMARSQDDPEIQDALNYRGELTPEQVEKLADSVRDKVRQTLVDELGERMEKAIDSVIADMQKKFVPDRGREFLAADLDMARQFIKERGKDQPVQEAELVQWIKRNRMEDVMAAIADKVGIDLGKVVNAFYAPRFDAILFIASAAGLTWPNFKTLLGKRSGRQPSVELLEEAYNVFQRLKPETARRVVHYAVSQAKSGAAQKRREKAKPEPEVSAAHAPAPAVSTSKTGIPESAPEPGSGARGSLISLAGAMRDMVNRVAGQMNGTPRPMVHMGAATASGQGDAKAKGKVVGKAVGKSVGTSVGKSADGKSFPRKTPGGNAASAAPRKVTGKPVKGRPVTSGKP
ncbi:DUF2336 domain-containing protein [Saliniramus sp.]|uniref:DUF2336 domain-containing protein n=1 Tax=Saliniramus sp. TaxID=2986772 RepID=UPI002BA134BF|nr:DUF2336 domain-containing protein [Saliniramus sp.]HMB11391.1 DUF2336 domain-containing protein [Saliniramus sp.]